MRKRHIILGISLLLIPSLSHADILTPLTVLTGPLLVPIAVVEGVVFWLLAKFWYKIPTGFWKALGVIAVANLGSSAMGLLIPISGQGNFLMLSVAYFLSVIIEWLIYIPFFRRSPFKRLDLLKLSFPVNLASYIFLVPLFGPSHPAHHGPF